MSNCKCCNGETTAEVRKATANRRMFLDNGDNTYTEIRFEGCQPRKDDLFFKKVRTLTAEEYAQENDIGIMFLVID